MQVTLEVTAGPHTGRSFSFRAHDTFIVGRASYAHFRLAAEDKYFSRAHFLVEVNPPLCRLTDMGSTNGTYVNGKKVDEVGLADRDLIRGGKTAIRVRIEPESDDAAAETAPGLGIPGPESPETRTFGEAESVAKAPGEAPPAGATPMRIAQFRVVRELGRGGMGVVHLATRDSDQRPVAIKTIQPKVATSTRDVERFLREAAILRELDHPGIVRFLESGEHEGSPYLVMEFVDGGNLSSALKQQGPFPIGRATRLVCGLLETLRHAHDRQFVHRDIKPGNLILDRREPESLKLADFGLARVYQQSKMSGLTLQGDMGGTIAFCAPEQITNFREARPASDLYSTAATLYMMLTGRHIYDFPNSVNRQVLMILQDEPIPARTRRPELPEALAAVIHRSLARDPDHRFLDAEAMRQALLPFAR